MKIRKKAQNRKRTRARTLTLYRRYKAAVERSIFDLLKRAPVKIPHY